MGRTKEVQKMGFMQSRKERNGLGGQALAFVRPGTSTSSVQATVEAHSRTCYFSSPQRGDLSVARFTSGISTPAGWFVSNAQTSNKAPRWGAGKQGGVFLPTKYPAGVPLLFLLLCLMTSCVVVRKRNYNIQALEKTEISRLDGRYSASCRYNWYPTLADFLVVSYYLKYLGHSPEDVLEVELKSIDTKHLEVKVFLNDSLESCQIVKGKIKDGFFVLKKQHFWEADLGGVFLTRQSQKSKIGVDSVGSLVISSKQLLTAHILLLPLIFVKEEYNDVLFKLITKNKGSASIYNPISSEQVSVLEKYSLANFPSPQRACLLGRQGDLLVARFTDVISTPWGLPVRQTGWFVSNAQTSNKAPRWGAAKQGGVFLPTKYPAGVHLCSQSLCGEEILHSKKIKPSA